MAPHSMESILQPPHWPVAFSNFVTWCLMWDPKSRPTSSQALNHDYFVDAIDPLRPKSSRLLGRKQSDKSFKSAGRDTNDSPALSTKASWFRRSLIGRDSPAPVLEEDESRRLPAISHNASPDLQTTKPKPVATKRATWTNGAPMPILPSIRPVSPLSNAVTAQANSSLSHANDGATANHSENGQKSNKKIGRQLSVNSNGNHYSDVHRQEAERALNGGGGLATPASATKESFFSHLRKRARRLSGRSQGTSNNSNSNNCDDVEANAGCVPWSNRSSMALDSVNLADQKPGADFAELDKALQNVRYSLDITSPSLPTHLASPTTTNAPSNRQLIPQGPSVRNTENYASNPTSGPISSRTRRALQLSTHPVNRYETPEEEDELLHEVLHSTTKAARHLGQRSVTMDDMTRDEIFKKGNYQSIRAINPTSPILNPYPTPSPSSKCDGAFFGPETLTPSKPLRMNKPDNIADKHDSTRQWPTPPYDESQWAESAAESIFAAVGSTFR